MEFDQRTTAIDQFLELTRAIHARSARVIIDLVANHTGWGSNLHENHPQWYARQEDGNFISPGAWGNIGESSVYVIYFRQKISLAEFR